MNFPLYRTIHKNKSKYRICNSCAKILTKLINATRNLKCTKTVPKITSCFWKSRQEWKFPKLGHMTASTMSLGLYRAEFAVGLGDFCMFLKTSFCIQCPNPDNSMTGICLVVKFIDMLCLWLRMEVRLMAFWSIENFCAYSRFIGLDSCHWHKREVQEHLRLRLRLEL
jgi:hypothetical protein